MKRYIAILLCMAVAFGAAACQKTPESPIVVGNNTEKMIEQAQKENSDTVTESCEPINLYVHLNAPKTYSQELVSKEGKLRVFADAQVLLPSCELPIVRVRPTEFTLEQVQCFAEVLIGDDAAYVRYDYDNQTRGACEQKQLYQNLSQKLLLRLRHTLFIHRILNGNIERVGLMVKRWKTTTPI